jgi:2-oxoglutarate ferredoxin oxidoreductase subunit gamma
VIGNGRLDLRLAGAGGQGIVTAGRVLAEAVLRSGGAASHSQAYGPASRGGASRSDVVVSDAEVGFPLVQDLDALVVLTGEAYRKYRGDLAEGGILVADSDAAEDDAAGVVVVPIVETAQRLVGSDVASGIVSLGVVSMLLDVVDHDTLEETIAARVPERLRDANLEAFAAGRNMVR